MFVVYVIKSTRHKWYYVGSTGNLKRRVKEHNAGRVKSTKFRLPYELIYTKKFKTVEEALEREKKVKQNRSLKERIINTALSSNG